MVSAGPTTSNLYDLGSVTYVSGRSIVLLLAPPCSRKSPKSKVILKFVSLLWTGGLVREAANFFCATLSWFPSNRELLRILRGASLSPF
jgi:hypothetical protein